MSKKPYNHPFSTLIVEIDNKHISTGRCAYKIPLSKIVNGEWHNLKITQLLDGLEISISGLFKTYNEFDVIVHAFSSAIKSLRIKLSNLELVRKDEDTEKYECPKVK